MWHIKSSRRPSAAARTRAPSRITSTGSLPQCQRQQPQHHHKQQQHQQQVAEETAAARCRLCAAATVSPSTTPPAMAAAAATGALSRPFFIKLGAVCFCVGATMELFMIKTGFYRIVTEAEAAKWEEERPLRQARAVQLRAQLLEQYRQRGQAPPAVVLQQEQQAREQQQLAGAGAGQR